MIYKLWQYLWNKEISEMAVYQEEKSHLRSNQAFVSFDISFIYMYLLDCDQIWHMVSLEID